MPSLDSLPASVARTSPGMNRRGEYLGCQRSIVCRIEFCPSSRIWRQTAYEVDYCSASLGPVDAAILLEYLRRRFQRTFVYVLLIDRVCRSGSDTFDSIEDKSLACLHQSVINTTDRIIIAYRFAYLPYYAALVDLVVQHEGCYSRLLFAVDYGPVYGSRSAVLR